MEPPLASRIDRFRGRWLLPRVEQTALCARALTGLVGRVPSMQILPAEQMTRAALTGEVLRSQNPVPWPSSIMRQLDPSDPAYLPPLGIHPVLAGRDQTLVGIPGRKGHLWVDSIGWCGHGTGPSVAVWFGDETRGHTMGRMPGSAPEESDAVTQRRGDDGISVVSQCTRGSLVLTVHHWPIVLESQVAWVIYANLENTGDAELTVRLGFAIRPACADGAAPIFELNRDEGGLWTADNVPFLAMAQHGDAVLDGAHGRADPFHRFSGALDSGPPVAAGALSVQCPAGQATATEVFRATLKPHQAFAQFAVFRPPEGTPATLVRTSGNSLWNGAKADQRGVLNAGATFEIERHQDLLVACRQRLLMETGESGLAGMMSAVALARLGFVRRAGLRLGDFMNRVRRDGSLPGTDPSDGAALAWAAAEFMRWTQDTGWRSEHRLAWRRLLKRLADDPGTAGGQQFFGADGSARWTAMWRAAALLNGAVQLRDIDDLHGEWALIGGLAREALESLLGAAPWSATPGRVSDGGAAALLAVAWIGVFDPRHPGVLETLDHVRTHHWHGDGVLLHGGAHPVLTSILSVVEERARPDTAPDPIDVLAALASQTGALPTATHPRRGALLDGDDLLGAVMFVLVALDRIKADRDHLCFSPDLVSMVQLPTPFGRVDMVDGTISGKWIGRPPRITQLEE